MFICLCAGATRADVVAAVVSGATTPRQVAQTCGVGILCGGCRHNVRAIIDSYARSGLSDNGFRRMGSRQPHPARTSDAVPD